MSPKFTIFFIAIIIMHLLPSFVTNIKHWLWCKYKHVYIILPVPEVVRLRELSFLLT